MRSLHASVLLCLTGTLLLALAVFLAISNRVENASLNPIFDAMDELELQDAVEVLHQSGAAGVSAYMHHLDQLFGSHHHLVTSAGMDVVSGTNLRKLLPESSLTHKSRTFVRGRLLITHESPDGQYWFVVADAKQTNRWTFFPYYLLVLGVTGVLYWLAAIGALRPIQRIAGALNRFGHADLSVRLNVSRRDEIGALARSFNEMARRIETLLASERRLLADISHELRSPITRLKFAVTLAKGNPTGEASFERIEREVDRITSLVAEINELNRVEGDPPQRKLQLVELQRVIDNTIRDCSLEAHFRSSHIAARGSASCIVEGDPELIRRALENVLRNAIRYSPEHSNIECDLIEDPASAVIVIRDYGPGVPEDMLAHIFEPFFRVEESRGIETGGVGLGLAIASRAVQVQHGTMTAENANPGLRIRITIPLSTRAPI